jgi:hypothetical protein
MSVTPVAIDTTSTGTRRFVVELSPTLPVVLNPQHLAAPETIAQVEEFPAVILDTLADRPET